MKRIALILCTILLCIADILSLQSVEAAASKKVKVSNRKVQIYVGKTEKIKLLNAPKKVKWNISNKKIAKITKKIGKKQNKVIIKGKKYGKTKIIARLGNKKYVVKIIVKRRLKKLNTEKQKIPKPNIPKNELPIKNSNVEIIQTVMNQGAITTEDNLLLKFTFSAYTNGGFGYGEDPGKLEILRNGEWLEMERIPIPIKDIAFPPMKFGDERLYSLPMSQYFENIIPGHYRYVKDEKYCIPVEFDVIQAPEGMIPIIKGVVKNQGPILSSEELLLTFSVEGNSKRIYYTNLAPYKLEKYEDSKWTVLEKKDFDEKYLENIPIMFNSDFEGMIKIPISEYFEDVTAGHYKYTHKVSGKYIAVEFDVSE